MKVCTDSSFLVKLTFHEEGSPQALDLFRSLNNPAIPYTFIHRLEVLSALAQKRFQAKQDKKRGYKLTKETEVASRRLKNFQELSLFQDTPIPWDDCFQLTLGFLPKYSEQFGCRTLDMVHIGIAKYLGADKFLTFDKRQAQAAEAEGLAVELLIA